MAKISDERKAERAARIQRRAQDYINGDISLDTFVMLEQLDNEDEADIVEMLAKEREKKEAEIAQAERRKEADKLRDLLAQDDEAEAETETKPAPKQPAPKRPAPYPPELDEMTAADYRKLSIAEMTRLYEAAPEKVREILNKNDRPAYMDIIDPRPPKKSYKDTTPEQFKQMKLYDLNELYNEDPALYMSLREQCQEGANNAG